MATIQFRGKRVDNDEWVTGNFFHWIKRGVSIPYIGRGIQNGSVMGFEVDPQTVETSCEAIAEEIAIGFNDWVREEWLWIKKNKRYRHVGADRGNKKDLMTTAELFILYKNRKQ